jgi:hypothetical protein
VTAVSVLTYRSEALTLTTKNKRKLELAEMGFLSSVAGISL